MATPLSTSAISPDPKTYDQMRGMQRGYTCSECRAHLEIVTAKGQLALVCGRDHQHREYTRIPTWRERWERGEEVPIWVADRFRKSRKEGGPVITPSSSATQWELLGGSTRVPSEEGPQPAPQPCHYCGQEAVESFQQEGETVHVCAVCELYPRAVVG